ncbi:phosphatidate cytidylyltransferase [Roseospira goensis]|uniref:Phosphatidate cytidylyltransferase n=1 Tax=Roseospira goensis TaxID=391922 RepID=A0A7W6WKB8_9PROT|nr:phosphatidate cytidylyltransferase [Roseospira goensis]MBB4285599.1 phosphatidate cytidylyltransferase [Roseospira goensis]
MGEATRRDALRLRIVSALVLGPLVLAAVALGWPWFDLLVAGCAAVMAWEWSTVCCGRRGRRGAILIVVVTVAPLMVEPLGAWSLLVPVAGLLPALYRVRVEHSRPLWMAAGSLYIGLPAIAMAWVRLEAGWETVLWLFIVVWTTDIAAYAFGRQIGGPRLWPRVSPKKTWAGLIGGVVSAGVAGTLVALALGASALGAVLAFGLVLGIVSQGGDLFESAFKRRFRVKDSGDLIPGHGGLLDRADGLIAATPVVALAVLLMQGGLTTW